MIFVFFFGPFILSSPLIVALPPKDSDSSPEPEPNSKALPAPTSGLIVPVSRSKDLWTVPFEHWTVSSTLPTSRIGGPASSLVGPW